MNVFDTRLQSPVTGIGGLYGRDQAMHSLEAKLSSGQQGIVLVGPEGSGKTSLLYSFFTPEYRKKKILEKRRIITAPEDYPVGMTCNDVYFFLQDIVLRACRLLEECGRDEDYLNLLEKMDTEISQTHTAKGSFSALVDFLYGTLGYSITLVLDQFEKFTCSTTITRDHHDMLNGLIDRKNLQFVVATDYDMTKVVLGSGSYLIQKFSNGAVRLDGLDAAACRSLADGLLSGAPVQLGGGSVSSAQKWSGGIPALLLAFLSRCYELKRSGRSGLNWERDVVLPVYEQNRHLLDHWCRYLDEEEVGALLTEVLHYDQRPHHVTGRIAGALARLRERGLLIPVDNASAQYDFCCTLLRRYIEQREFELSAEEYTVIPGGDALDNLRQALQGGDLTRAIRLISSRSEEELPVLFDALSSDYGRERAITQEEYAALGFTPQSIAQLRQEKARICAMLDDAVRAGRMVRLLDDDAPDMGCDYSIYIYAFFRPLEQQIMDCVFPLVEAWPSSIQARSLLELPNLPVTRMEKGHIVLAQYENFLRTAAASLARMCRLSPPLQEFGQASAWTALANAIKISRSIRNDAIHPEQRRPQPWLSSAGITLDGCRRVLKSAYTDAAAFHRLSICPAAAEYLARHPNTIN